MGRKKRYGQDPLIVVRSKPPTFNAPLKWTDPARVFTCSWSDFFHPEAEGWRDDAWDIVRRTPHLTYQILTTRIERAGGECLPRDWDENFEHVWLGLTVENADTLHRIETLSRIPCRTRFISFEPLLGPPRITGRHRINSRTLRLALNRTGHRCSLARPWNEVLRVRPHAASSAGEYWAEYGSNGFGHVLSLNSRIRHQFN